MNRMETTVCGRADSIISAASPVYKRPYCDPREARILLRMSKRRTTIMNVTRMLKATDNDLYAT